MTHRRFWFAAIVSVIAATSCKPSSEGTAAAQPAATGSQLASDSSTTPSIARVASDSKDHTTLVAALKAADWLDALANPGPFTVFAPMNAAFDKLPAGTVETLLKPENKAQLKTVLLHHVMVSAYEEKDFTDGASLAMLDGGPTTVKREGDAITIDGAKIVAAVRAGNGWVYVVDAVLVPGGGK
jgi:uncharacterized surface protein with fasciclin (FAS1) repeats